MTYFIQQELARACHLFAEIPVHTRRLAAKLNKQAQGISRMFIFDRRILLLDAVLIDSKSLPTEVGNEVSIGILHEQLNGYRPSRRIEVNVRSLLALASLEQRRRAVGRLGLSRWSLLGIL